MKVTAILLAIAFLFALSGNVSATKCDEVLEKAPADAKSKFKILPSAAVEHHGPHSVPLPQ